MQRVGTGRQKSVMPHPSPPPPHTPPPAPRTHSTAKSSRITSSSIILLWYDNASSSTRGSNSRAMSATARAARSSPSEASRAREVPHDPAFPLHSQAHQLRNPSPRGSRWPSTPQGKTVATTPDNGAPRGERHAPRLHRSVVGGLQGHLCGSPGVKVILHLGKPQGQV